MPDWLDNARYALAVLFVISVPPAIAWWFVVHPLVAFWRRVGPRGTFVALGTGYVAVVAALFPLRDRLLGADLGVSPWTASVGVLLALVTVAIALARRKHLTFRILAGVPEIDPGDDGGELLDQGIYGVVRHPRYLEFMIGGTAWALILGYAGVYVMQAAAIASILVIVPIEERELRDRFGDDYADYCRRVPRFVPRLRH